MKILLSDTIHEDVEFHPTYPFLTKITFNNSEYICIIDNVYNKLLGGYVLDFNQADSLNDPSVLNITLDWYNNNHEKPISLTYEKLGFKNEMSKFFKTFHVNKISYIKGPVFSYVERPKQIRRHQFKL